MDDRKTKGSNNHPESGKEHCCMKNNDAQSPEPRPLLFVLGGPGSGKGTQCDRIASEFGFKHYSAGDLLRQEVQSGSERGKLMKKAMDEGGIVQSEWVIDLLKNAIESAPEARGYLIDGFPKESKYGPLFEKQVQPCDLVLVLECSEDTMKQRIRIRMTESNNRSDDNESVIDKRVATYKESLPVIEHYERLGKVAKVNAEKSIEEVYANIKDILKIRIRMEQLQ